MNAQSECSRVVCVVRIELYGSTTAVDTWGAGYMANSSFDFLPKSTDSRSMRRDVKPEPVPPPNEWNTRKPWRPEHWSDNLRTRSRTRSTISLPMV